MRRRTERHARTTLRGRYRRRGAGQELGRARPYSRAARPLRDLRNHWCRQPEQGQRRSGRHRDRAAESLCRRHRAGRGGGVNIVTVAAVKVPPHLEIVKAAIGAGKHVYCEWPLGSGLAEAEEMPRSRRQREYCVVGTQARVAPEIAYLRVLIADGFVGDVLSTTLVARGGALQGGGSIPDKKTFGYLLDRCNGATLLTIPVGHTLAALRDVFGEIAKISSVLAVRRPTARVVDTGEILPVTAPDQVLVSAVFASGVPVSLHYRGGAARDGDGLFWEIHGTEGDIRVSGESGHTQMVQLSLKGARGAEKTFRPLEVPASYRAGWPEDVEPGNVARLYARMARDLRDGTRTAPSFKDAVAVHRIIAAIENAAESGSRAVLT